jgi:hypothetical protein
VDHLQRLIDLALCQTAFHRFRTDILYSAAESEGAHESVLLTGPRELVHGKRESFIGGVQVAA